VGGTKVIHFQNGQTTDLGEAQGAVTIRPLGVGELEAMRAVGERRMGVREGSRTCVLRPNVAPFPPTAVGKSRGDQ
jgi:hypothetical protein